MRCGPCEADILIFVNEHDHASVGYEGGRIAFFLYRIREAFPGVYAGKVAPWFATMYQSVVRFSSTSSVTFQYENIATEPKESAVSHAPEGCEARHGNDILGKSNRKAKLPIKSCSNAQDSQP